VFVAGLLWSLYVTRFRPLEPRSEWFRETLVGVM